MEIVRRIHDAWNLDDTEAIVALLAPDVEYVNPTYAVEGGVKRGHAGFREVMENLRGSFKSYRHDPQEILDRGDHVIVRSTFSARGRGSGVEVERQRVHAWTLRNGEAVRVQWFNTVAEALEALGLSE